MAYELDADRNVLTLVDKLSGTDMDLYYRMPSNKERVQYDGAMTKRKGSKIVVSKDWPVIQAKFGAAILVGFEKGCFTVGGKMIASDPEDPDYYKGWKNLVLVKRADLLRVLANTVFQGAANDMSVELEDEGPLVEDLDALIDATLADDADTPDDEAEEVPANPLSGQ